MESTGEKGKTFVGYDYKETTVDQSKVSLYLDSYINLGWQPDDTMTDMKISGKVRLKLKRDRKIANKTELTRLQRYFEACAEEIQELENSKTSFPTITAISTGIAGTACMAGSVFAVTNDPPVIWLCILLAVPGFSGWALPYYVFKKGVKKRTKKINPLIEQKYDEIYEICEKASRLL